MARVDILTELFSICQSSDDFISESRVADRGFKNNNYYLKKDGQYVRPSQNPIWFLLHLYNFVYYYILICLSIMFMD